MEKTNYELTVQFKTLLSVFGVNENPKIQGAFDVLNNKKSTKSQKNAAKGVIINTLSKSMLKSDILKLGLTTEQYKAVKSKLKNNVSAHTDEKFVSAVSCLYKIYINASREYAFVETSRVFEKTLKGKVNETIDRLLEENWELWEGNNTNFERLFEIANILHAELGVAIEKSKKKTALEHYKDIDEEYKVSKKAMREDLNLVPIDACDKLVAFIEMEYDFYLNVKGMKKQSTSKKKQSLKDKVLVLFKKPSNKKKDKKKKQLSDKTKKIIAVLTAAGILVGAYFVGRSSKKNIPINNAQDSIGDTIDKPEQNEPVIVPPVQDEPVIIPPVQDEPVIVPPVQDEPVVVPPAVDIPIVDTPVVDTEKELLKQVNVLADSVYSNWKNVPGNEYTRENIVELIKCLNGLDSQIDLSTADDMLVEILNKVTVPAVNNMMLNTNAFPVSAVEMSDLLLTDVQAIDDMESYLNGALANPLNRQVYTQYLNCALVDEHIILNGKTYKGFNLDTAKPEVRLLWSRMVIGTNAMLGTLGEEYAVIVNGEVYTSKEVDDYRIYDSIANDALKEMGFSSKSLIK